MWCKSPSKKDSFLFPEYYYNKCHTDCEKFLDDDITDDLICLTKVYEEDFSYWLEPWCAECRSLTAVGKFPGCPNPTLPPPGYFDSFGSDGGTIPPIETIRALGSSGPIKTNGSALSFLKDIHLGLGMEISKVSCI